VTLTFSQTVSSQYFTGESLTFPSTLPASAQYFTEIDDITSAPATKIGTFGPATLTGLLAAYTNNGSNNGGPPSLTVGHTYLFQFYYTPASTTPTPTPTPSATATATTTGTPTPTPTPTGSSSSAPTPTPTSTPSSSPSVKPDFVFNGAAATPKMFTSSGGGPISAGPDLGVTVSTTWGANNQSSTSFTESLATGSSQITPNTFPVYNGTGHVVIYIKFTATPATTFTQTPGGTITVNSPSTFGGTACVLYSLNGGGGGSAYTWQQAITGLTLSGSTLTLTPQTLQSPSTVDVGNPSNGNSTYLALVCQ
jgi:hypothetical protein